MADDSSQSRRHAFKSKWSKILKSDEESGGKYALDSNVSDFLKTTPHQQPLSTVPAPPVSTRPIVSPRIDIALAQRWPDASQLRQNDIVEYRIPSPLPIEATKRPSKRKGLNVGFVTTDPELIGYGGEESQTPTVEISRSKPAVLRSKSERRPQELSRPAEVIRDRSPYRPGMGDRARTAEATIGQGNAEAFSSLMSAGVFADRPPSRDDRSANGDDDVPNPGMFRRTPTGFSSLDDEEQPKTPDFDRISYSSASPPSARKPVPTPTIQVPELTPEQPRVIPRILRDPGDDDLSRTQQRMRDEEGRAFSRAYRLSQTFQDPENDSRPSSSQSNSHPSQQRQIAGGDSLADLPRNRGGSHSSQESLSLRNKPAQSPRIGTFLQPSAAIVERQPPQHADNIRKPGPVPPQDYIDFFKGKTRSRSNPSSSRDPSRERRTQSDSPLQPEVRRTSEDSRLRVDVPPSVPQSQSHHESPPDHSRDIHARKPIASRRALPVYADAFEHSPQSAKGEIAASDRGLSHDRQASSGTTHSSPDTPERTLDPTAIAAWDNFAARVTQMKGVFSLTSQKERAHDPPSARQWLRCAFWWLQKGKSQLEQESRSQRRGLLNQAHVDLAKSWWILSDELRPAESSLDLDDRQDILSLQNQQQSLALQLDKGGLMPPQASLIQGQNTRIWLPYPKFSPDLEYLLGCTAQMTKAGDVLPLGDTKHYFFYQSFAVTGTVNTDDPNSDRARLPCMLSILRHRLHYRASVLVASQNELVNALVGPDLGLDKQGPTWYDIAWQPKSSAMSINLPRGLVLHVSMDDQDYQALSTMVEYTRSMDKSFHPAPGESLVFSSQLVEAQYSARDNKQTFPPGRVRRAFVGVFQDVKIEKRENTTQKMHRNYRLMLITPSTSRSLGIVNHIFDAQHPFVVDVPKTSPGPTMVLLSPDKSAPWHLAMTFESEAKKDDLLNLCRGLFKAQEEYTKLTLALRSLSIAPLVSLNPAAAHLDTLEHSRWEDAILITHHSDRQSTVLNDSLRLVLNHSSGSIVDRLNLGPGELLLRLPVTGDSASIEIARLPQQDVQVMIDRSRASPQTLDALIETGRTLSTGSSCRKLAFASMADLHALEEEITGYRISFDGRPAHVSITRSRKVVSIHKKLEATHARLQVLNREGDYRIMVFFEDFPAADAMSFQVKGSDEFERVKGEKNAKFGVKLIEAKFNLPKKIKDGDESEALSSDPIPADVRRKFLNPEGLEYAEEHDDIVVAFENEMDADNFCEALPGTVHAAGRSFLSKRRI